MVFCSSVDVPLVWQLSTGGWAEEANEKSRDIGMWNGVCKKERGEWKRVGGGSPGLQDMRDVIRGGRVRAW